MKPIRELGIAYLGHNSTQIPQPTHFLRNNLMVWLVLGMDSLVKIVNVIYVYFILIL